MTTGPLEWGPLLRLARIELRDAEIAPLHADLERLVVYLTRLEETALHETDGSGARADPDCPLREDRREPGAAFAEIARRAPAFREGTFVVAPAIPGSRDRPPEKENSDAP